MAIMIMIVAKVIAIAHEGRAAAGRAVFIFMFKCSCSHVHGTCEACERGTGPGCLGTSSELGVKGSAFTATAWLSAIARAGVEDTGDLDCLDPAQLPRPC